MNQIKKFVKSVLKYKILSKMNLFPREKNFFFYFPCNELSNFKIFIYLNLRESDNSFIHLNSLFFNTRSENAKQ